MKTLFPTPLLRLICIRFDNAAGAAKANALEFELTQKKKKKTEKGGKTIELGFLINTVPIKLLFFFMAAQKTHSKKLR